MKRAEVLGFISTKGGVGKTTVVSNLGYLLANKYNKSILLVEGNFTAPSLGSHFGLVVQEQGLADAMAGKVDLKSVIKNVSGNLDFLPVGFVYKNLDYKAMRSYLCSLRSKYDFILIDSSPSLNAETFAAIYASDKVFMITTPDHIALNSVLQSVKLANKCQTYISGVILNRSKAKIYELTGRDIEEVVGASIVCSLDDDDKILKSLAEFKTVVAKYPNSNITAHYNKLASAISGASYKSDRFLVKLKGLFSHRISQEDINRTLLMESHY